VRYDSKNDCGGQGKPRFRRSQPQTVSARKAALEEARERCRPKTSDEFQEEIRHKPLARRGHVFRRLPTLSLTVALFGPIAAGLHAFDQRLIRYCFFTFVPKFFFEFSGRIVLLLIALFNA